MNIVVTLIIFIGALLIVHPAQAMNNHVTENLIPSVMSNSLRLPLIGNVFAYSETKIKAIHGSGEKGSVSLKEVPQNLDTRISVKTFGLNPEEQYIVIYHKNTNCEREDNSVEKSIKGAFYPDQNGEAFIEDIVTDSTNRIGSVSIRTTKDFELVACGSI